MALDRETPGSPTSFLVFLPKMLNFCLLTFTSKGLLLTMAIADFTGPLAVEGAETFRFHLAAFPIFGRAACVDACGEGEARDSLRARGPGLEVQRPNKMAPGGNPPPAPPLGPDRCPPTLPPNPVGGGGGAERSGGRSGAVAAFPFSRPAPTAPHARRQPPTSRESSTQLSRELPPFSPPASGRAGWEAGEGFAHYMSQHAERGRCPGEALAVARGLLGVVVPGNGRGGGTGA